MEKNYVAGDPNPMHDERNANHLPHALSKDGAIDEAVVRKAMELWHRGIISLELVGERAIDAKTDEIVLRRTYHGK